MKVRCVSDPGICSSYATAEGVNPATLDPTLKVHIIKSKTMMLEPVTLHERFLTLRARSYTLNLEPRTLNPEPWTKTPKL